jgi:hypothetical protein
MLFLSAFARRLTAMTLAMLALAAVSACRTDGAGGPVQGNPDCGQYSEGYTERC